MLGCKKQSKLKATMATNVWLQTLVDKKQRFGFRQFGVEPPATVCSPPPPWAQGHRPPVKEGGPS